MKVYAGNWALYSDPGFNGLEDRVKPGFTSYWLGIYAPVKGEPISLYSNDLSSLKPVGTLHCMYVCLSACVSSYVCLGMSVCVSVCMCV